MGKVEGGLECRDPVFWPFVRMGRRNDIYATGSTKMGALQHTICADLKWTDSNDHARGGLLS
jgi:hypothetical protein